MNDNKNNSKNINKDSNILSFNNLLELIEISKFGQILSENKKGNLDIITIEKLKQVIIGDCKCWICKINSNDSKLGLYHFVDESYRDNENNEDSINKKDEQTEQNNENNEDNENKTKIPICTEKPTYVEKSTYIEKPVCSESNIELDGFWYQPNMDSFDADKYYYVKKDKYGHVINTYQIKHTSDGKEYLQIGVPRANGRDYTIRTYFVTDIDNFEALKKYEWKVYKDKEQYKVACICDVIKDGNKTGTRTLKAIEVIAGYQKMDLDFIKDKHLDSEWGFGPEHDKIITRKNGKSRVVTDGKRLSVFTKNGNEFMCFSYNLKVAKYVDIVSSKYRRRKKNESKNKSKSVGDMLREIKNII